MYRWFKRHELKMLRAILNRKLPEMRQACLSLVLWGVALPCIAFFVTLGIFSQSFASLAEPLSLVALIACAASGLLGAGIVAHSADLSILLLRSFIFDLPDKRKETLRIRLELLEAKHAN